MKVVIVGAGSVGSSIARELLAHKHEILLIDLKPDKFARRRQDRPAPRDAGKKPRHKKRLQERA